MPAVPDQMPRKPVGERRFAERTDRQTGKSDAELHPGNHALQVAKQGFHNFCAGVATGDELAYPRKDERRRVRIP